MASTVAHGSGIRLWQERRTATGRALAWNQRSGPRHHGVVVHAVGEENWNVGRDVRSMYPSAEGKVVLVTGGGGSLGGNVSLQLAKLGAKVILADVDVDAVADTVLEIRREVQG